MQVASKNIFLALNKNIVKKKAVILSTVDYAVGSNRILKIVVRVKMRIVK